MSDKTCLRQETENLAMTTATAGTTPCKKELILYLRMSQLCRSLQYACRSKNLLRLNMHRQGSIPKEDTKNQLLRFVFSKLSKTQARFRRRTSHEPNRMLMKENKGFFLLVFDSAHVEYGVVVVLQRTPKKCTKIQNAREQLLFCLLNLLFGDALLAVAVVVC